VAIRLLPGKPVRPPPELRACEIGPHRFEEGSMRYARFDLRIGIHAQRAETSAALQFQGKAHR
jgi:hypothetical protein